MFEFFLFMTILLAFGWGAMLLYYVSKAFSNRLDGPPPGPADALLREEVESLAHRLGRVEEELEFYKRLSAPVNGAGPDDDA